MTRHLPFLVIILGPLLTLPATEALLVRDTWVEGLPIDASSGCTRSFFTSGCADYVYYPLTRSLLAVGLPRLVYLAPFAMMPFVHGTARRNARLAGIFGVAGSLLAMLLPFVLFPLKDAGGAYYFQTTTRGLLGAPFEMLLLVTGLLGWFASLMAWLIASLRAVPGQEADDRPAGGFLWSMGARGGPGE